MGALEEIISFIGTILYKIVECVCKAVYYTVIYGLSLAFGVSTLVLPWRWGKFAEWLELWSQEDNDELEILFSGIALFGMGMLSLLSIFLTPLLLISPLRWGFFVNEIKVYSKLGCFDDLLANYIFTCFQAPIDILFIVLFFFNAVVPVLGYTLVELTWNYFPSLSTIYHKEEYMIRPGEFGTRTEKAHMSSQAISYWRMTVLGTTIMNLFYGFAFIVFIPFAVLTPSSWFSSYETWNQLHYDYTRGRDFVKNVMIKEPFFGIRDLEGDEIHPLLKIRMCYIHDQIKILLRGPFRFFLDICCYIPATIALVSPIRRQQFMTCLEDCVDQKSYFQWLWFPKDYPMPDEVTMVRIFRIFRWLYLCSAGIL